MASDRYTAEVAALSRTATIIWAALTASVALYGGVLHVVTSQPPPPGYQPPPEGLVATMSLALRAVAVLPALASQLVPRLLSSPERMRAALPAEAPAVYERQLPGRVERVDQSALSVPERRAIRALPRFAITHPIIAMALAESVAIFGLVLGFVARDLAAALPNLVAGGVLILLLLPRVEETAARLLALAEEDARTS